VSNLELLLGMAAHGVSVLDVLRTKASPAWRQRPLQHVMAHMSKGLSGVRPPVVEAAFRDVVDRAAMKMFGRHLPEEHQAGGAMETVTVTKEGEPYNRMGFIDLPLSFKRFEPDYGGKRVRLGGKAVHELASALAGFRDKQFDLKWEEQVFRGCRVVEEQADSAVIEYVSDEEVGE
jgi:hypothetical protein